MAVRPRAPYAATVASSQRKPLPHPATVTTPRAQAAFGPHAANGATRARAPHLATLDPRDARRRTRAPATVQRAVAQDSDDDRPPLPDGVREINDSEQPMPALNVDIDQVSVVVGKVERVRRSFARPDLRSPLVVQDRALANGAQASFGSTGFNPCIAICAFGQTDDDDALPVRGVLHWSGFCLDEDAEWPLRELRRAMIDAGADEDDIRIVALNPTASWPGSFLGDLRPYHGATVQDTMDGEYDNGAMNLRMEEDGEILFSVQRW
jgi:hypothetical protein